MDVSPSAASAALQDVAAAEARSATLRGYQSSSPHLIIWGIAWAVGYSVSDLVPAWANATWIGITVVGVLGDILAARADRRAEHRSGQRSFVLIGLFATIVIFVGGSVAVMAPTDPRQIGAFIPLVVAAAYAILGLMDAPRMLALGAGLAALTLTGFFALPAHFLLWMAAVGGSSLVLGGVWLRKA